ncbi:MAG: helix-turn-helix transcriptional regulator [Treponema sp.]|nr:helix-turn-helix transcriptional regulator [Treponema sp.]
MNYDGKKEWFIAAVMGTVFTAACLVVSVVQFFFYRATVPNLVVRYTSLFINMTAFCGFIYLLFDPLRMGVYVAVFYFYGVGNIVDSGNMLGFLCLLLSAAFLYQMGFFSEKRVLKAVVFALPPTAAFVFQFFYLGAVSFFISLFHICASCFIFLLFYFLYRSRIHSSSASDLTAAFHGQFSEMDEKLLSAAADGKRYTDVAQELGISESTVKSHMIDLYKKLGVKDKAEFLAKYHTR